MLFVLAGIGALAEARTNNYCAYEPYYGGKAIDCGGHLQPGCNQAPTCDDGHNEYTGSGLPTINCPEVRMPITNILLRSGYQIDITSGCYDRRPTCADCGAQGQPPCPDVAAPICSGCDDGYSRNSITGLCEAPGTPGQPCGPGVGCSAGLDCNPFTLRCEAEAQVGDSCANPFVSCADGLQCTLALRCSTAPKAQLGETCDATAPCDEGLYCEAGVPQRCRERRKPGQECNVFQPCVDGAFCLTDPTRGLGFCYPDPEPITPQRCESFYSASVAQSAPDDKTQTHSSGGGKSAGVAESNAHGVAYGQDGEFGCFNAQCSGYDVDVSIEGYVANGRYDDYHLVEGESFSVVTEGQLPGSLANISVVSVYGDAGLNDSIGIETAASIGIGLSPIPATVGVFECSTELITIYGDDPIVQPPIPGAPGVPLPGPPAPAPLNFGALQFDGLDDAVATDLAGLPANPLPASGSLTLETWIRPTADAQTAALLSNQGLYRLGLSNGELVYRLGTDAPGWPTAVTTGITPPPFEWTHVALVHDAGGGTAELYVNAELVHVQAVSGAVEDALPTDEFFSIGGTAFATESFDGQIDSLRLWSRALTRLELLAGLNTGPDTGDPDLKGAWAFDEPDGDALIDAGPAGLDLALAGLGAGSAPARVVDGRNVLGGSAHFNGEDEFIAVDVPELLEGLVVSSALTLEAWIYPTGPGSDDTSFGGMILSKEGEYSLGRYPDGRLYFALDNDSPDWVTTATSAVTPEGAWSHVALTYDSAAGEIRLYLNGSLVETRAGNGSVGDQHPENPELHFGGRERGNGQMFEGLIDEVRIWNLSRSGTDIASTWDKAVAPDSPGLLGYWRFDEGPVALAFDSSPATRHAYLGGGAPLLAPARVDAGAMTYPQALLAPACGGAHCPVDADGDGVSDYRDNCLLDANEAQTDGDVDGYGNRCDGDFDNSGGVNFADLASFRTAFGTDDAEHDLDGSGVVNFADLAIFRSLFGAPPGPSAAHPAAPP